MMQADAENDTTGDNTNAFDVLAEQFSEQVRQGNQPDIEQWVVDHPEQAEAIRGLFPLIARIEGAAAHDETQTEDTTADRVGQSLGEYRVLREVGRGGMGVVYEAEQVALGRRVALKVLPPSLTLDPKFIERFQTEARAAARLTHPHLVPVIDYGEADGVHFYAMQFIEGCGLDDLAEAVRELERAADPLDGGQDPRAEDPDSTVAKAGALARRLTAEDVDPSLSTSAGSASTSTVRVQARVGTRYYRNVARMLLDATDAVAYAHGQGVLHRDIKPSNLMLESSGTIRVTDFGICKDIDGDGVTQTGDVLGTYRYMAPERLEGVSDVRGDVYGLGITLYELLTRKRAYGEENRAALIARIAQGPPPRPRALDSSIPADLETIVRKATAHEPERRYATAAALALDLRAYLERRPITARAPTLGYTLQRAVSRHKAITATVAAALITLVAGGIWYVRGVQQSEVDAQRERVKAQSERADALRQSYRAEITAAGAATHTSDANTARRLLAEINESQRGWEWHVLHGLLDSQHREISGAATGAPAHFLSSPNHRYVALVRKNPLIEFYDLQKEELTATLPIESLWCIAWHPDNDRVAIGADDKLQIYAWPSLERIASFARPTPPHRAVWAKDGKHIVLASQNQIVVLNTETGDQVATRDMGKLVLGLIRGNDASTVVAGFEGGSAAAWSFVDDQLKWERNLGNDRLGSFVAFGRSIAVMIDHGRIDIVSASTGVSSSKLARTTDVTAIGAHPSGRSLFLAGGGRLRLQPINNMPAPWRTLGAPSRVETLAISPDGARIWIPQATSGLACWYVGFGDQEPTGFRGHFTPIKSLAASHDGRFLASGGLGATVRIWDVPSRYHVRTLHGHHGPVTGTVFMSDGDVLSVCAGGRIIRWNVQAGTIRWRVRAGNAGLVGVGLLDDANVICTADETGHLCRWDATSGKPLGEAHKIADRIAALVLSPKFNLGAASDDDGNVLVFDTTTFQVVATCSDLSASHAMDWKHGEPTLMFARSDGSIAAWSQRDGISVVRIAETQDDAQSEVVDTIAVRPTGDRFITGSRSGAMNAYRMEDGAALLTLRRSSTWIRSAVWSPDGSWAAFGDMDGRIRLWKASPMRVQTRLRERNDNQVRAVIGRIRELVKEHGSVESALSHVETLDDLSADQREIVRQLLHRQRGFPWTVVKIVRASVERKDRSEDDYAVAAALGASISWRANSTRMRTLRTLAVPAAASIRAKKDIAQVLPAIQGAEEHLSGRQLPLLGWIKPFEVIALVKLGDEPAARKALAELDALWEQHETMRNKVNASLRAEARAAVEAMSK